MRSALRRTAFLAGLLMAASASLVLGDTAQGNHPQTYSSRATDSRAGTPGAGSTRGLHVVVMVNGASTALVPARQEVLEVLDSLDGVGIERLRSYTIELEVIPGGEALTDLAAFSFLRHRDTFDGRAYSSLRAVGPTADGGTVVYAVGVEEIERGPTSTYGPGFAVAHESGHVVRHYGLSADQDTRLRDIYVRGREHNGPWLTDYSASNDDEYFADATAAYFGHPWSPSTADRFSRAWLAANDPEIYRLLREVYAA
jgi:hypothetical protein